LYGCMVVWLYGCMVKLFEQGFWGFNF